MASLSEVPLTQSQHNISIAEIAIFSIPLALRMYKSIHQRKFVHDGIFIVLFCLVRIIGGALYLTATSPTDSVLIGALILESLGSTLLLAELSRLLVYHLDYSPHAPTPRRHVLRRAIQLLRLPILITVIIFVAAYNISSLSTYRALAETAAIVILAIYLATAAFFVYFFVEFDTLVGGGRTAFLCVALSLPFLLVRILYLVLGAFRVDDDEFVIVFGDWRVFVGMGLVMEVMAMACFVVGGFLADEADVRGDAESAEVQEASVKYGP